MATPPPTAPPHGDGARPEDRDGPCDAVRDLLSSYAARELPDQERARVMNHLSSCPACQRDVADYHRVIVLARTLPAPTPPPAVEHRLRRAIAQALRTRAAGGPMDETREERPLS